MQTKESNLPNRSGVSEGKNTKSLNQKQTIFHYLQQHTATASMVSDSTGIYQKNICRYKADLQKSGYLWEIEKSICKITGFKAFYLTTDPNKAPKEKTKQLNFFHNE